MNHFFETIPGFSDGPLLDLYREIARRVPANGSVVEVGSWLGHSAAFLAVEIINLGKQPTIYAVDTWTGIMATNSAPWGIDIPGDMCPAFINNMIKGGVGSHVHPMQLSSVQAAATFADGSQDVVFIDGDHTYDFVKADILAWMPKVKSGGWLCGHDYRPEDPGVIKAVDELLPNRTVKGSCWVVDI